MQVFISIFSFPQYFLSWKRQSLKPNMFTSNNNIHSKASYPYLDIILIFINTSITIITDYHRGFVGW